MSKMYDGVKNSSNFVYASRFNNADVSFDYDFLILKAGDECLKLFMRYFSDGDSVIGLDAQFKNNKERLPVWIVCAQSAKFSTISGFVIITEDATEDVLVAALGALEQFIEQSGFK